MKKNNKNNKGFSLVELIIVIAIMAILIGVLAPQYLKFVERSRQSTDKQNVDEIIRAIEIYAADPLASDAMDTDATTGTVITFHYKSKMTIDSSGANADEIYEALKSAGIITGADFTTNTTELKSNKWDGVTITIKVDDAGNVIATASDSTILQ